MDRVTPMRGDVWYADLGQPVGHEQGGTRPAVIISHDGLNRGKGQLVIALPLTTKEKRGLPYHVRIDPPEAGLKKPGFIKCEDIRSISTDRLLRRVGAVSRTTMAQIETRVRRLLGLSAAPHVISMS
jgi:mRNA interferase MazF